MNDTEKSRLKSSPAPLIEALTSVGVVFKGRACKCPFCDDAHPSAGIFQREGMWFYKCHKCQAGGDIIDILAKIQNKTTADVLREMGGGQPRSGGSRSSVAHQEAAPDDADDCPPPDLPADPKPRIFASLDEAKAGLRHLSRVHVYTDPVAGKPEMYVFRIEPPGEHKRFLQGRPGAAEGEIILRAPEKPWPIYNRARVRRAKYVIVVEGEKAVEALTVVLKESDIAATTSPGGAGKGECADWTPLAGKIIYLWSDNDPANEKGERVGIAHMRQVQKILEGLDPAPLVYWIDLDGLEIPPKGDAVEFLEKYPDNKERLEQVRAVMAVAEPQGASAGVKARIEDAISGRRETIALPWADLHRATYALKPGTVTLICGDGGAAKSLLLLQLCQYWHFELGHKLAIYELEDDREYHLTRALAQRTGEPGLTQEDWVKENPQRARQLYRENQEFLDRMGQLIYEAPTEAVSLCRLSDWVTAQAEAGKRIICVDPITAAASGKESWIEDQAFLIAAKKALVEHECSLVLVTHPRKGGNRMIGMDNLAGGACWSRFSQTIFWMKSPGQEKKVEVFVQGGCCEVECNRIMSVLKARNGTGGGNNYAMFLRALSLTERGQIIKRGTKAPQGGDDGPPQDEAPKGPTMKQEPMPF
jgi:hypothetical protein